MTGDRDGAGVGPAGRDGTDADTARYTGVSTWAFAAAVAPGAAAWLVGGYAAGLFVLGRLYRTTGSPPIAAFSLAVLLVVAAVQFGRAARADDWSRRAAALAVVPAFVMSGVALGPGAVCQLSKPPQCAVTVDPFVPGVVAGVAVLTVALCLDVRGTLRGRVDAGTGRANRRDGAG